MQLPLPITRELVLVGGGHAHALVLRMWAMAPLAGARVTLINPAPTAPYTGMLPGHVAGKYRRDELDIDLVRLARFAGARLLVDRAVAMDADGREIVLASGRRIPFDIASVDVGITSGLPEIPGFADHAVAAKPLDAFADAWGAFLEAPDGPVVVIGAGVGGVELALAMRHALVARGTPRDVTLIDNRTLLTEAGVNLARRLRARLDAAGIAVRENCTIQRITEDAVELADGAAVTARFVVGAAGARPHAWLAESGLHMTAGFVTVAPTLRSVSHAAVFAAGDCSHLAADPRPKAGVFAVRAAPVLLHNLRAALAERPLRRFRPQRHYLKLVSLPPDEAMADKWDRQLSGRAMWLWKDRIDRRFMRRFAELSPMRRPPLPRERTADLADALGPKPLCGGCGAKVGGGALNAALAAVPKVARADIFSQPGDDAAVLQGPGKGRQVLTTDHLRAFTEDPGTMAQIAAVHALGDIWAMGASPQAALASIVLPPLSEALQASWLDEIMGAAGTVFAAEGAAIVGGHTSQGAELTIGFSVTGLTARNPIEIGGGHAGDALILTKAIGTGTILAAEMQLKARGDWVIAALRAMAQPQGDAARILARAHAMTDVTGFGLAGHALAMARASRLAVEIDPHAVPLLSGAAELAAGGTTSSLYAANRADFPDLDDTDPAVRLLFDPQTAGGLLAAVPNALARDAQRALVGAGFPARIIGRLVEGRPALRMVSEL